MSRFLLLNFEDFGLNQDITKTIQSFNPFCICCLDRESPMIDLDKCSHSSYLDAFGKPQLKHFNQLVCLQCHSVLKKINSFQQQVIESFQILLSGNFTNTTVNTKRLNTLVVQKTIDTLQLPPEPEVIDQIQEDIEHILPKDPISDLTSNTLLNDEISNIENNFIGIEMQNSNLEQNMIQNQINKNIKTALEIIERNNQSFVTLGSQLQFLNGEHLSFLEPSLLSKEILTDLPLVPAKSASTDLENELIHTKSLGIEIDGPERIFYDDLDLSPDLMEKGDTSEMIDIEKDAIIRNDSEHKSVKVIVKPKKKKKMLKSNIPEQIKAVRLTQEQLNKERVQLAQSDTYLRFKYRCETCLIGFNYVENLEDHMKRKHGPKEGDSVVCDICSQVIPSVGAMTQHNYRHYTRYECLLCTKIFQTHDEATTHLLRKQCKSGASTTNTRKKPRPMKTKLKLKRKKDLQ